MASGGAEHLLCLVRRGTRIVSACFTLAEQLGDELHSGACSEIVESLDEPLFPRSLERHGNLKRLRGSGRGGEDCAWMAREGLGRANGSYL